MRSALANLSFISDETRTYRLPGNGSPSMLFVFDVDHTLGARAYSNVGDDFREGTTQADVRLDFWADDPWTDVVEPGARFTIWYGGDIGHGVIERVL